MISVYSCSTRTRNYRGQAEQLEISKYRDVSNSLTTIAKDFMVMIIDDLYKSRGGDSTKNLLPHYETIQEN